jgi:hypothetical protein
MVDTPWIVATTRFSFNQAPFVITENLRPSRKSKPVVSLPPPRMVVPVKADIARRLKLKSDTKLAADVKSEERPGILLNLLMRALTLAAGDTVASDALRKYIGDVRQQCEFSSGDSSLMRDMYKGFILELSQKVSENQAVASQFERAYRADIPVRALLSTAAENRKAIDAHKARERDEFRLRLRRMPDALRDITSRLIDLGLAPYLISKEDRDVFMKELQEKLEPETEPETDNPLTASADAPAEEGDIPEEGLNDERDVGPDGEVPQAGEQELEVDYGDYGDRRGRTADGEEAEDFATFE